MLDPTTATADQILDNMEFLVERERLVRGSYLEQKLDPELSGALCQGHRACAIGSLWLSAGVPVEVITNSDSTALGYYLPATDDYEREEFLNDKPGLNRALDALNKATEEFAVDHDINLTRIMEDSGYQDPIEALFEHNLNESSEEEADPEYILSRDDLLSIIIEARTLVQTPGAVTA